MAKSFFFYDLETSGLSAREDRIMQFAGQRTDMDLNPVGEPVNVLIRLNDDTLPSPDALLVTGITPQKTVEEGYSEAEFARQLSEEIATPDTCMVGFNNVRFDDEFIRHFLWRNFHDPYEWSWKDGRSRWDLLDVVRMTRALRPDGIEWPVDKDGKAVNKLELLAKVNGITHSHAHDALSDVEALIDVTRLIRDKQPQLFKYLFDMRDKKAVQNLVNLEDKQPFVYVSGRYDAKFNKATVAFPLTSGKNSNVVVYDLRYDPTPFVDMSADSLTARLFASWEERRADDFVKIPTKELQYNRCPAVAPLGVLEQGDGWSKIRLDKDTVEKHRKILLDNPQFAENIRSVFESGREFKSSSDAEAQLYDSFLPDVDRVRVEAVRNATESQLADFNPEFKDERLASLLLRYKARSYPNSLTKSEHAEWEEWRAKRLQRQLPAFLKRLSALSQQPDVDTFMLEEMQLWAESIMPAPNEFSEDN